MNSFAQMLIRMKTCLAAALLVLPLFGIGQIANKSFEDGDSDSISSWNIRKGTAGTVSGYTFKASTGDTTVSSVNGDQFAVLKSEGTDEGVLRTTFPLKKSPAGFKGDFIYLNENIGQRFSIEITYLKWVPALLSHDTIMHVVERINPNVDSNSRNYNWLQFDIPITRDYFNSFDTPDSCSIVFRTHATDNAGEEGVLLIDHLFFSSELISGISTPEGELLSLYPNPSRGNLTVDGLLPTDMVSIIDLTGKVLVEKRYCSEVEHFQSLPRGLYILSVDRNGSRSAHRFSVQ